MFKTQHFYDSGLLFPSLASFRHLSLPLLCTHSCHNFFPTLFFFVVINVTLPDEKQNYVHRIGRVGRAERWKEKWFLQYVFADCFYLRILSFYGVPRKIYSFCVEFRLIWRFFIIELCMNMMIASNNFLFTICIHRVNDKPFYIFSLKGSSAVYKNRRLHWECVAQMYRLMMYYVW